MKAQEIKMEEAPKKYISDKQFHEFKVPTESVKNLKEFADKNNLDYQELLKANPKLSNSDLKEGTEIYYPAKTDSPVEELQVSPQELDLVDDDLKSKLKRSYKADHSIKYLDEGGNLVTSVQQPKKFKLESNQDFAYWEDKELGEIINNTVLPVHSFFPNTIYRARTSDNEEVDFIPLFVSKRPVMFDSREGTWNTSLEVILQEIRNGELNEDPKKLNSPVSYNVYASDVLVDVFEIEYINVDIPPRNIKLHPDTVRIPETDKNTVLLGLRETNTNSWFNDEREVNPFIRVSSHKNTIQGYGIETTLIDIELLGVSDFDPIEVSVRAENGFVEPQRVELSSMAPVQTVSLRSKGAKKDVVTVASDVPSSPDGVDYVFPWVFLLFAIIGGIIGTLIRMLPKAKKGFRVKAFIAGVLTGFIVALAYWAIGLNLLNFNLDFEYFNEGAVLVLSALGGIAGSSIFKPAGTS